MAFRTYVLKISEGNSEIIYLKKKKSQIFTIIFTIILN